MIERALDNRWLRIVLGAAIGIPFTAAALVGSIYGVIFLVGGLRGGEFFPTGVGLAAALGMLGVVGAWRRLLKPQSAMSHRERMVVRFLLFSGIASSTALAGVSLVYAEWPAIAFLFALIAAGGVALVLATPTTLRSNPALNTDAERPQRAG